jgi:hypothetical protein
MKTVEEMIEQFKQEHYLESSALLPVKETKKNNKFEWGFIESPFFTDMEIFLGRDYYAESSNESYHDYFDELGLNNDSSSKKSYSQRIMELQNQLKSCTDPEECDFIKQQIYDLGWNPEIEYTFESQKMARDRFIKLMSESMISVDIEDMTSIAESEYDNMAINESVDDSIYPVHVVLVKGNSIASKVIGPVTNSEYTHSAIGLDYNFNKLYSYNFDNKINNFGGFSLENVNNYPKENKLCIYTFFVSKDTYNKIEARLQYLLNNIMKTTYSVTALLTFPFRHIGNSSKNNDNYICSEFVDSILKLADTDITNTNSSKVSPAMLYNKSANSTKMYKTYEGPVKDLDQNKIKRTIKKLSKTAAKNESCIVEARKFPIEVKDNGDVLLTNPIVDFDAEYMASHKLLIQYEKSNNIQAMKYELARLYYMNYILERKIYHNKFLSHKEKNIKTRARILNDFNKYIKFILKAEPDFNFGEYYKDSIFYPHTVEIKKNTIHSLKNIISYIL